MAAKFGTSENRQRSPGRRHGSGREAWRRPCRSVFARDWRFKARGGWGLWNQRWNQAGGPEWKILVWQRIIAGFDPSRPSQRQLRWTSRGRNLGCADLAGPARRSIARVRGGLVHRPNRRTGVASRQASAPHSSRTSGWPHV
jgi:hypothetical protein